LPAPAAVPVNSGRSFLDRIAHTLVRFKAALVDRRPPGGGRGVSFRVQGDRRFVRTRRGGVERHAPATHAIGRATPRVQSAVTSLIAGAESSTSPSSATANGLPAERKRLTTGSVSVVRWRRTWCENTPSRYRISRTDCPGVPAIERAVRGLSWSLVSSRG